jgi:flagellar export protein FliJ
MAFQFSLESVLRVRGMVEEREERLLQRILFEVSQTREALASTIAEIAELDASHRSEIFKPLIGRQIHASYGKAEELRQRRKALEGQIHKFEELRNQQRIVYESARRNREMLTDMRIDKRSDYESDLSKREQRTLDDNFIARRGRF